MRSKPSLSAARTSIGDAWLGLRVWSIRRTVGWAVVAALAWQAVPRGPVAVPARDGVASVLWPLVPALFGLACTPSLKQLHKQMELRVPHPRAIRLLLFGVQCEIAVVLGTAAWSFDLGVAYRNLAAILGLAALSAAYLTRRTAWVPMVVFPMATWLFGALPQQQGIYPWAFLLETSDSWLALCFSLGLFVVGGLSYVLVRPSAASAGA